MKTLIDVHRSKLELVKTAAREIMAVIRQFIDDHDRCTIALAGGSTPRDVYARLANDQFKSGVNWKKVQLFWGDERTVPPEHADSNFRMVREILLDRIDIPAENVHRIYGEIAPKRAAIEYSEILTKKLGTTRPSFDLVLLGVGEDGHTASLFPGTQALEKFDENVVAVFVPRLNTWRITLTLPLLNASKNVMFILSGASKAVVAKRVINATRPRKELPATLVRPEYGTLHWLLDSEAARLINSDI